MEGETKRSKSARRPKATLRGSPGASFGASSSLPADGRGRVVIESITPTVDGGRFPIKRTVGEDVEVEADLFSDGHDVLSAVVRWRAEHDDDWHETQMEPLVNDRWRAAFTVPAVGRYRYRVAGWVARFATWRRDLAKKLDAGVQIGIETLEAARLVDEAAKRASGEDAERLRIWAEDLGAGGNEPASRAADDAHLADLMAAYDERAFLTEYPLEFEVWVDRERARFSTWYELFPRSASPEPGRPGTLRDVVERSLPYVSRLGFDVLYLPPIHPIGRTHRKGPNNIERGAPSDVGSPWAIGAEEGGHTAIHPDLGTLDDFDALVDAARVRGIEVAMDVAFQCAPDHPWVREHPEWFRHRADGSIAYAENPPKKYQDIYPIDFETDDWRALWEAMRDVFRFWMDHGVRIFRVDNPHTKPFAFWEWVIDDLKKIAPETIFLSEAFTRPRVMYRLAKLGFTQSYTYFTWRSYKWNLTEYLTELTQSPVREFCRPNLWPNTPDILTEELQYGGRAAFVSRLILAATLGANYGVYGPAFEHCESRAVAPGKEEYLDSEKYQIRYWDLDRQDSLADLIARVNRIRRENPALQSDWSLRFHGVDNDRLLCYSKASTDGLNVILVIVSLDHHHTQSGWTSLWMEQLGLPDDAEFQVHDLISEARYVWHGPNNYVELRPNVLPAHIFRIRRRSRSENDFEYFM